MEKASGGARWDATDATKGDGRGGPRCPFCGSIDTEELSPFASQLSTRQYVCRVCRTAFEYFGRDSAAQ